MKNYEAIEKHFSKIEKEKKEFQIRNIDFIYLINLDQRPDRLTRCMEQFKRYNIEPQRTRGINGWSLSQEAFNDIAMQADPSKDYDAYVQIRFAPGGSPGEPYNESLYGKPCLHRCAPAGGMGGCLTHLSIINDAWLSGYNTIWILEDDITAKSNPHSLADFLDKLDIDAGERTWDLLYTDDDDFFSSSDVCSHFGSSKWIRPGMPLNQTLLERRPVGNDFFKIGGRTQAHSYILRRTGMKKILDFVKSQGLFLPFDTELPCVPDLQLYNLRYDVVHGRDRKYSDTWNKNF